MKKFLTIAASAALVAGMTGCVSQNASKVAGPIEAQTKSVVATPDVQVVGPVSGTASFHKILGLDFTPKSYADGVAFNADGTSMNPLTAISAMGPSSISPGYSEAKAAAAYSALEGTNADIILNPNYKIEEQNFVVFSRIKCTVTGFGAKVKGISKIEYKDYKEMELLGGKKKPLVPGLPGCPIGK